MNDFNTKKITGYAPSFHESPKKQKNLSKLLPEDIHEKINSLDKSEHSLKKLQQKEIVFPVTETEFPVTAEMITQQAQLFQSIIPAKIFTQNETRPISTIEDCRNPVFQLNEPPKNKYPVSFFKVSCLEKLFRDLVGLTGIGIKHFTPTATTKIRSRMFHSSKKMPCNDVFEKICKEKLWYQKESTMPKKVYLSQLVKKRQKRENDEKVVKVFFKDEGGDVIKKERVVQSLHIIDEKKKVTKTIENLMDEKVLAALDEFNEEVKEKEKKSALVEVVSETTYELHESKKSWKVLEGGIQPYQNTISLGDYLNNPIHFECDELEEVILLRFVWGAWDDHHNNVGIAYENNKIIFKFYDNTKIFPPCNGYIHFAGMKLVPAFRCALLDFPQCHQHLPKKQITKHIQMVEHFEEKICKLEDYFKQPHVIKQLRKIPLGWLEPKASISAMKERIKMLKAALNNPIGNTIENIIILANPEYKFTIALGFIDELLEVVVEEKKNLSAIENSIIKKIKPYLHADVGNKSCDNTIYAAVEAGFDILKIKKWCEGSDYTIEEILKKIVESCKQLKNTTSKMREEAQSLISTLKANAKEDYRDTELWVYNQSALKKNKKEYKKNNIFIDTLLPNECNSTSDHHYDTVYEKLKKNPDCAVLIFDKNGTIPIYIDTFTGLRKKIIQPLLKKNTVKVDGKALSIEQFIDDYKKPKAFPVFEELVHLRSFQAENFLKLTGKKTIAHVSTYGKNFMISGFKEGSEKGSEEFFQKEYIPNEKEKDKFILKEDKLQISLSLDDVLSLYFPR